jgi:predicted nucleic acid-binding protein
MHYRGNALHVTPPIETDDAGPISVPAGGVGVAYRPRRGNLGVGQRFDLGSRQIATAVEMLLDHERLVVQDAHVVGAAIAQLRKKPTLGFSDCLILEVARRAGHLPLGTFDRQLGHLADAERLA